MFLKNAWYVGALSTEVGRSLHAVKMLNENVLMYRKTRRYARGT